MRVITTVKIPAEESVKDFTAAKAEEIRLRYLYRKLVMNGRGRGLSMNTLKSLVGPDCAYHLYSRSGRRFK